MRLILSLLILAFAPPAFAQAPPLIPPSPEAIAEAAAKLYEAQERYPCGGGVIGDPQEERRRVVACRRWAPDTREQYLEQLEQENGRGSGRSAEGISTASRRGDEDE